MQVVLVFSKKLWDKKFPLNFYSNFILYKLSKKISYNRIHKILRTTHFSLVPAYLKFIYSANFLKKIEQKPTYREAKSGILSHVPDSFFNISRYYSIRPVRCARLATRVFNSLIIFKKLFCLFVFREVWNMETNYFYHI